MYKTYLTSYEGNCVDDFESLDAGLKNQNTAVEATLRILIINRINGGYSNKRLKKVKINNVSIS